MLASKLILNCLVQEGVDTIFGYPGGALLPLYEAFRDSQIKHVLVRNEQTAPHYASGYARQTGKVGVCLATSGPGATNMITGIATAYLDSVPIVAITGQVNRDLIGSDAFQEADITGACEPFTKHSYLVKKAEDIPRIIKEAFYLASTGRPGPVLIDIPRDVQLENVKKRVFNPVLRLPGYKPTIEGHTGQIRRAIRKIRQSAHPLIYAGGGVRLAHAEEELLAFAEKNSIPVISTLMGISTFPQEHPLYCGVAGSHGFEYSNHILNEADLCICIGARMSDRGVNNLQHHLNQVDLIHIDIDPAEIGKNINQTEIPIVGDAKAILLDLLGQEINKNYAPWHKRIAEIKQDYPLRYSECMENGRVNPKRFFEGLGALTKSDSVIFADVGLNQIWSALYYPYTKGRKYFTSGGLGTMGYSIPAAAGAAFAAPESEELICICGDGSFQMSMGELAVIAEHRLNTKIILFTNHKLGMVRQLQHDTFGKDHYFGTDLVVAPDFMKLAEAYGIPAFYADTTEDALEVVKNALSVPGPVIVQLEVDQDFLRV